MVIGNLRDALSSGRSPFGPVAQTRIAALAPGWRILRRASELLPLTPLGFALGLCSGLGLFYFGYGELDRVWYVAALGLLALAAVCVLTVAAAAIFLATRLAPAAGDGVLHTETERALPSGFELPSLRRWLFLHVSLGWHRPAGARVQVRHVGSTLREEVLLTDHGDTDGVERRVVVGDSFGIARVTLRQHDPLCLRVLPHCGELRSLPLLTSLAGGDDLPHPMGVAQGDRLELRRYAPGDPARFLHWKIYARTRKLVVRTPERALARAYRSAAYLIAGERDAASAAAARVAIEEGALGDDWRFGADGTAGAQADVEGALTAIRRSASARAHGGSGLLAFLDEVEREGPVALVLFVPARPGPWQRHASAVVARCARPPRVVVGVDGLLPDEDTPLWRRLVLSPPSGGPVADRFKAVSRLVREFEALQCEVLLLDRQRGRVLGDAHLSPLRGGALRGAA